MIYKLLQYKYTSTNQGTEGEKIGYALLKVPDNFNLSSLRTLLMYRKNLNYEHEIDRDSIVDLTITF